MSLVAFSHNTYDDHTYSRNQKWITGVLADASSRMPSMVITEKYDIQNQCFDMPEGG